MSDTSKTQDEAEFLLQLQEVSSTFFKIGNTLRNCNVSTSKKFDLILLQETQLLENFLDDSGARGNKTYHSFAELVASVRNFATIMYLSMHVKNRIPIYQIEKKEEAEHELIEKVENFHNWASEQMNLLFKETFTEAHHIGLLTPTTAVENHFRTNEKTAIKLERNIERDDVEDGVKKILELTSKFRKTARYIQHENFGKRYKQKDLERLIPFRIDEKKARKFRNNLHGVQSDYDTYVKGSSEEEKNQSLKQLRGFISFSMHMLDIITWMAHFYERHLATVRIDETKQKISNIINHNEFLERLVKFGMNNCHHYLQAGNEIAENILTFYSKPITIELPVPEPIGFHARPSHYLSLVVNEYGTDVFMIVEGEEYSCKSVMMLLQAGAILAENEAKTVVFKGDEKVLHDIKILAEQNYCEDKDIPQELNYLRIARNYL